MVYHYLFNHRFSKGKCNIEDCSCLEFKERDIVIGIMVPDNNNNNKEEIMEKEEEFKYNGGIF